VEPTVIYGDSIVLMGQSGDPRIQRFGGRVRELRKQKGGSQDSLALWFPSCRHCSGTYSSSTPWRFWTTSLSINNWGLGGGKTPAFLTRFLWGQQSTQTPGSEIRAWLPTVVRTLLPTSA